MNMILSDRGLVDLDVRKLVQSKEELAALTVVKTLNASGNELTKVAGLQPFSSVCHVDLSRNKLVSLRGFPLTITHLNVAHNNITSLEALSVLSLLHTLDISHNKVSSLAGISPHAPLRTLKASYNFITGLQPLRGFNCSSLRLLALDSNYVKDPAELRALTACHGLVHLSLSANPFAIKYKAYQRDVVDVLPTLQVLDGVQVRLPDTTPETAPPPASKPTPPAPTAFPPAPAVEAPARDNTDGPRESLAQILASPSGAPVGVGSGAGGGSKDVFDPTILSALSNLARELGIATPGAPLVHMSPRAGNGEHADGGYDGVPAHGAMVSPASEARVVRHRTPLEDARLRELLECSRRLPHPKTPNRADLLPHAAEDKVPFRAQPPQEVRIVSPPVTHNTREDPKPRGWRAHGNDSVMSDARRLEVRCEELQRLLDEAQTRNAILENENARKSEELSNANRIITEQTRAIGGYKQENRALNEKYQVLKERADKLSREFKLVHRANAGLRAQAGANASVNQSVESAAAMLAVPPPPARRNQTPPHRERHPASPAGTRPRRSATPPVISAHDTTQGSTQPALRNSLLSSASTQRGARPRETRQPVGKPKPAVPRQERVVHDPPSGHKRSASADGYVVTPALAEPRRSSTPSSRGAQPQPAFTRTLSYVSPAKS